MNLRSFTAALQPNRVLSKPAMTILIIGQVAVAIALWVLQPLPVIPTPQETLVAFGRLWTEQGLSRELATSFTMNLEALAITTALALALAYVTVLPFFRPIVAAASKGRFLGMAGLTFLFTMIVGGGRPLKLSLLVFGMTVFFVTSMADVVASIPRDRFDHARTLRMNEWRVVWEVVVLGTKDKAVEVLRQNAAIGWMMLTMVEGISRAEGGIGAMLLNQDKHFHLAEVFAAQITILLVGIALDYGIGALKHMVAPHAVLTLERR